MPNKSGSFKPTNAKVSLSQYWKNGGVVSNTENLPSGQPYEEEKASGVWRLNEQSSYKKAGQWPEAGNVYADQVQYTSAGTYTWTCPIGVHSVSVVCVGGGGGGMHGSYGNPTGGCGGGLGYKNNIAVTAGTSYTVVVGNRGSKQDHDGNPSATDGGDSYFISAATVKGGGGAKHSTSGGGTYVGDGGGNGGNGASGSNSGYGGGGGGAGGYSGNGGNGGSTSSATSGTGGAGGGGKGGGTSPNYEYGGGGGGGVGLQGEGTSGAAASSNGTGGSGGSGGTNGGSNVSQNSAGGGGSEGGGGGGVWSYANNGGGNGGVGAVRIIWGENRAFPNTNTEDV